MLGIHLDNPKKIDVSDPTSDDFYNYFRQTAKKNALIYEEVFATLPSDHVRKFEQLNGYSDAPKLKETDPILVRRRRRRNCSTKKKCFSLGPRKIKRNSRFHRRISFVFS